MSKKNARHTHEIFFEVAYSVICLRERWNMAASWAPVLSKMLFSSPGVLPTFLVDAPPPGLFQQLRCWRQPAATMLLAGGCRRVGDTRFLRGGCGVGHGAYFPMMKFNEIIRMMRVTVVGNHPWYSPEKLTREP